jgi:NAD/NADP transhydrogenase beta subunit
MLTISVIIFAAAAIFGFINLLAVLGNKQTSKPVVFTHGILAAIALVLLIIFIINSSGASPTLSLILFIIVALVGFFMFARDLSKKSIPKAVALIHGIVAVISFIILLIFIL